MKMDWAAKSLLILIALLLAVIVFRPVVQPAPVRAQVSDAQPFYIEPGVTMIRKPDGTAQVYGKMVVDMRTGDIWGFPTMTQSPFPVNATSTTPPKSHPIYLGKFMFSEAHH